MNSNTHLDHPNTQLSSSLERVESTPPISFSNSQQRSHQLTTCRSEFDVEAFQIFYLPAMIEVYQKNKAEYPNPYSLIQNLKNGQKKYIQMLNNASFTRLQQTNRRITPKYNSRGLKNQDVNQPMAKEVEQASNKKLFQEYMKIRYNLLAVVQHNFTSQEYIAGYSLTQDEYKIKNSYTKHSNISESVIEIVDRILKNMKLNIKKTEQKVVEKWNKKLQAAQQKYHRQQKIYEQLATKLNNKIKQLVQQSKIVNQQIRKAEKQKKQLHIQMSRNHQYILQKTNSLESHQQKIQDCQNKIQSLQKCIDENKKIMQKYDNKLVELQTINKEFVQKNRQLASNNDRLYEEITKLKRMLEEQMFNNLKKPSNNISSSENVSGSENGDTEANTSSAKLYRVKSSEKLSVGEKYLKDSSYSNNNSKPKYALDQQVSLIFNGRSIKTIENQRQIQLQQARLLEQNLQITITELQSKIQQRDKLVSQLQKDKTTTMQRQRTNIQKVINEWKQHLQRIIEQNQRQAKAKDLLIQTLQRQINQLRKQILIKDEFINNQLTKQAQKSMSVSRGGNILGKSEKQINQTNCNQSVSNAVTKNCTQGPMLTSRNSLVKQQYKEQSQVIDQIKDEDFQQINNKQN